MESTHQALRPVAFLMIFLVIISIVSTTESRQYGNGSQPRILIVGAGVSGLAAAVRLLDNGLTNLTILEAEGRIGGRVFSFKLGEWTEDYGAHWVHGGLGNPVYELANPLDLIAESGDGKYDVEVFSDGSVYTPNDWGEPHPVDVRYEVSAAELRELRNVTLYDAMYSRVKAVVDKVLDQEKSAAYAEVVTLLQCTEVGCDSLRDASARMSVDYLELNSSQTLGWKGKGYGSFIDLLLRRHEKSSGPAVELGDMLHLNTEVTKIEVQDEGVQVHTAKGTVYTADMVLVTVSAGVLKNRLDTLFQPAIPKLKKDAINAIGFGTIDKVIMRFPYNWWPRNTTGFQIIWLSADKAAHRGYSWETEILVFAVERWSPYTLTAWLVGEPAKKMERTPIPEVREGCMRVLRRFLGSTYNISEPVEVIRSTWGTNPHFLGSYSYRNMEAETHNVSHIVTPLLNKDGRQVVFFGGEATHNQFYSTVHGALETGWREADRIISLLR